MLRAVLSWLLMLGVVAGLSVRAVPELQEMTHVHPHEHGSHDQEITHSGHDHDSPCQHDDSDPEDEGHQPCGGHHHHHGCGCAPVNFSAEVLASVTLSPPGGSLLGVGVTHDRLPEPPVFEEDAPPLI